jgi:hypothetical protein
MKVFLSSAYNDLIEYRKATLGLTHRALRRALAQHIKVLRTHPA